MEFCEEIQIFTHFDPFCPFSMARKFLIFIVKFIFMDSSKINPFQAVFTHFEPFLPILTHFAPLAWPENSRNSYQSVFILVLAKLDHFNLFLPILSCFYPFCPISMARKFKKFQLKCIFMDFSEITHFELFLPI